MKITLAQLNYHIGNFKNNTDKIIKAINQAKNAGSELIVFSELSITGYTPHDLLEQKDFVEEAINTAEHIASHCTDIAAIIGCPTINQNPEGKKLFNSALFLQNGKIEKIINKTLLPTYDIFDEYRYFEPNDIFQVIEINKKKIALTICEDLWDEQEIQQVFSRQKLYKTTPMDNLIKLKPELIINIAGSPFSHNQKKMRINILKRNAKKYNLPLIYVNQIGAQTELIFDGGSMFINSNGDIVKELKYFEEDISHINTDQYKPANISIKTSDNRIASIYQALVLGVKDYFTKNGFKKAVLGLSGGIDSAVTIAIAADALGPKNVDALLMPSQFSSQHSIDDAIKLADNLNLKYYILPINELWYSFNKSLSEIFANTNNDITEENIQARARGVLLMAYSNKFGHIVLNTSNKSEAAVGYTTLYGDMNGGLSVLGDVYKTDVYLLAKYINRNNEIIPENTITKPPSAELRPDQKDSDSLPEYNILDDVLFQYIEQKKSASEIQVKGMNKQQVIDIIKMVNQNEYKRFQAPPILRVSSKAFGFGRRMPLVAKY